LNPVFGPDEGWTLYHGDCLDVLPTLDPVEAVVTDPPYGLEFMGSGSTGKAADLEGCHFVGIDSDAASCAIAAQRRRAQRSLPLAVEA
jgi:DNA modification methylase